MASSPFLLLFTCNHFLLAVGDLKRGTCRSSATQTPRVSPSFLTQSVCETLCASMSASCHLTASRLVWAPSSSSSCLLALLFYPTAQHWFYLVPVHLVVTAQLSRHAQLFPSPRGAILLIIELAPSMQDEDEVSGKSIVALSFDQWLVLRHPLLLSLLDSLVRVGTWLWDKLYDYVC